MPSSRKRSSTSSWGQQKAGFLAVTEYKTEELANDSEDEKKIKKMQGRALKQKQKNASKNAKKTGLHPAHHVFSLETMGYFFEVLIFLTLSLNFEHSRKAVTLCLLYSFVLCFNILENENVFPLCAVNEMRKKEYTFSHFSRQLYLRNEKLQSC